MKFHVDSQPRLLLRIFRFVLKIVRKFRGAQHAKESSVFSTEVHVAYKRHHNKAESCGASHSGINNGAEYKEDSK